MDFNPDTINSLIGAKVVSYKNLEPISKEDEAKKKEDFKKKQDLHANESPYDLQLAPLEEVKKSKKELRREDAFSFLTNELDDIYDDLEEGEPSNKYIEGIKNSINNIKNVPKKKFYHSKSGHKRRVREHYDNVRRGVVGNSAALIGEAKGYNPEMVKDIGLGADRVAASVVRKSVNAISRSLKK